MTRGERRHVQRLLDAAVPAGDGLPPAQETDAAEAFAAWLDAAPAPNRLAIRALLRAVARGDVERRIESGRGPLGGATQFLARVAAYCYYGDERVLRALGYDAREVAARGLALRRAEGRV